MCKAKCRLHNKLKRVERGKIMLVAKKEAVKINVANKKPLIRKNQSTGEMVAGFLDPESGVFEVAMEITDERYRVYDSGKCFIGVYEFRDEVLYPVKIFYEDNK